MSYILDALKNSDQERKKGAVPDLQSQPDGLLPPAPGTARPRRRRILLWIPLLLLLAVILAWQVQRTPVVGPGEPSAPAIVAAPEPEPPVEATPVVAAERPPTAPLPVDDDTLDALKDVRLDAAPIMELEAMDTPTPDDGIADAPAVASGEPVTDTAPGIAPAPAEADAVEPAAIASPEPAHNPYAGIPHQHELPPSVQSALPQLEITVHIYSDTPSSRLARINRRNYQEGDVIEGQLTLDEITPDGLILSFGDIRYWRYVN